MLSLTFLFQFDYTELFLVSEMFQVRMNSGSDSQSACFYLIWVLI